MAAITEFLSLFVTVIINIYIQVHVLDLPELKVTPITLYLFSIFLIGIILLLGFSTSWLECFHQFKNIRYYSLDWFRLNTNIKLLQMEVIRKKLKPRFCKFRPSPPFATLCALTLLVYTPLPLPHPPSTSVQILFFKDVTEIYFANYYEIITNNVTR